MGLAYNVYLNGAKIYGCHRCKTHLADNEEIISRVSLCRYSYFGQDLDRLTYCNEIELPRPAWKGLSFQHRCERHRW